jgi:glycosyltransferase involved in cell wall biosynthesis
VIALSVEWKQWVLGVEPDAKVEVVFNSLARNTGAGPRTSFDRKPTVLFLGRIGQRKGTFDLLRAFAAVKSAVPEARLVVGGDGDAERLLAEAQALCVRDAVTYVGWVEGDAKSRLIAECWVLALPSYHEGLPMAILEAMAFSRAVVSCPVGGISQAVMEGETGFLVQPGDVSTLTHRLMTILSGPHAAAQMGRAGRRVFEEKFSHEGALPKVLSLYREAGVARMPRLAAGSEDVS